MLTFDLLNYFLGKINVNEFDFTVWVTKCEELLKDRRYIY